MTYYIRLKSDGKIHRYDSVVAARAAAIRAIRSGDYWVTYGGYYSKGIMQRVRIREPFPFQVIYKPKEDKFYWNTWDFGNTEMPVLNLDGTIKKGRRRSCRGYSEDRATSVAWGSISTVS